MCCGAGMVFLYMLGYFTKIKFTEKEFPGMHIVYAQNSGDYKKIQGFYMWLGSKLKGNFKEDNLGFGIYYDDPKKVVNQEECRCIGGVVLSPEEIKSESYKEFLKKEPRFRYKYLRRSPSIYTSFPYINYASFQIADQKIWPSLRRFLKENPKYKDFGLCQGECIEVYNLEDEDFRKRKINYYWPLG